MNLSYPKKSKITIRTLLSLVILISFIGKGLDIKSFEKEVKTQFLPFFAISEYSLSGKKSLYDKVTPIISVFVWVILANELLIGLMLIVDYKTKIASLLLISLLCLFSIVLIVNILYPSSELKTCGCFGVLWEEPITWWSVLRNVVLIGMAWIVYRAEMSRE